MTATTAFDLSMQQVRLPALMLAKAQGRALLATKRRARYEPALQQAYLDQQAALLAPEAADSIMTGKAA